MRLVDIKDRLPQLVYNLRTRQDGKDTVSPVPVMRMTEAHKAAAHAAFVRPAAPWIQDLDGGGRADRPFEHTGNEGFQKTEEAQFRHRKAAMAAIVLGVRIDDPQDSGRELSWQSIAQGDNTGDRMRLRTEYARLAGLEAIDKLTAEEIDTIIEIASGAAVDADGRPIAEAGRDTTNDGEPAGDDLVGQLGNSSAPGSPGAET